MYSVTILTKNSQRYLREVLTSLKDFEEIIIADTGSTDQTVDIAKKFPNVHVIHLPFTGFGPTHNAASAKAKNNWILSIDSDEIMTPELSKEIFSLNPDASCVYSIWRKNIYNGKHIRGCGWYPDRVLRLYNKEKTSFTNDLVHETISTTNMHIIELKNPLIHKPFYSISSFIQKTDLYSSLYAKQKHTSKKSILNAFFHALYAFTRSYIFQRGFLLGREGLEISWYNMNCAFYKYAKLGIEGENMRNDFFMPR